MTNASTDQADLALHRLGDMLRTLPKGGLPPVESWNPALCGAIDIRIAADGTWFHEGRPIRRPALVRLFSTILRREPDGSTVLVTPAECMTITVEDAAFVAVEMAVEGEGLERRIAFRTNTDDLVPLDAEHSLRCQTDDNEGLKPYVHVRRGLWARLTRALAYDLVELADERIIDGEAWLGVSSGGTFHKLGRSDIAGAP